MLRKHVGLALALCLAALTACSNVNVPGPGSNPSPFFPLGDQQVGDTGEYRVTGFRGEEQVGAVAYEYDLTDSQYQSDDNDSGAQFAWISGYDGEFDLVETVQFVDEIPEYITVAGPDDTQCLSAFDNRSAQPYANEKADGSARIEIPQPAGGDPSYVTLVPWTSTGDGCDLATELDDYDDRAAIAVFSSTTYWADPPADATVCRISADDADAINAMYWDKKGQDKWSSEDGQCIIDKPKARGDVYTGTLYTMLTSKDKGPLFIELAPDAELFTPLNSIVAGTSDANDDSYDRCVLRTEREIILTGFGRMDGERVNLKHKDRYSGTAKPAKYLVDSGLLVLGSQSTADFGIDLSGLTIANGPIRNEASVALNDGNYPHCGPDNTPEGATPGYESSPVKVVDLKRPGVWWPASDALEVSANSVVDYAFLHSADDAIKISAPGQSWSNITVMQGNAGGVINIGSYGYNSGTAGTTVDGVFVARVLQRLDDGRSQWDDRGGLITTRTCAQPNQRGEPQNVTDVAISNFIVPSLGGVPEKGRGQNTYVRAFSIGVVGDTDRADEYAIFCARDGGSFRSSSDVTMGNFSFTNFDLYQNGLRNSLIYDGNQIFPSDKKTNWKPIKFCETDGDACKLPPPTPEDDTNRPVTFWVRNADDGNILGDYICGPPQGDESSGCWTTANQDGPSSNVPINLDYADSQAAAENQGAPYDLVDVTVFPLSPPEGS